MKNHLKTTILLSLFMFCLICSADKAISATPPLVPFNNTGDLFVLDHGSDSILRITPAGDITIEVTTAEITAVTGELNVYFNDSGIAFDAAGAMYFAESESNSIMKKATDGTLAVLTSENDMITVTGEIEADPEGIAFGSDGFLYVNEHESNSVLRINPSTGAVTVLVDRDTLILLLPTPPPPDTARVAMQSSIVGAEGGMIYSASDGIPDAIFAITSGGVPSLLANGTPPFNDLDVFMTRAQNGDLIISDNSGADTIHRVTPAGVVTTFISKAELDAIVAPNSVDLEGGIAFDSSGNFYVAEENTDSILKFDSTLNGSIWIREAAIQAVTGVIPDLDGGIAFAPGVPPAIPTDVPTINQWGMIILSLLMAGAALWIMRRKQTAA